MALMEHTVVLRLSSSRDLLGGNQGRNDCVIFLISLIQVKMRWGIDWWKNGVSRTSTLLRIVFSPHCFPLSPLFRSVPMSTFPCTPLLQSRPSLLWTHSAKNMERAMLNRSTGHHRSGSCTIVNGRASRQSFAHEAYIFRGVLWLPRLSLRISGHRSLVLLLLRILHDGAFA